MHQASTPTRDDFPLSNQERKARWCVCLFQTLFLLTALIGFDSPFLSAHNERQNQTFDVARRIFHDGWRAVIMPKTSFSLPGYPSQPFTIARLEVPFHGLLGWPVAAITNHERAAVRLVSVVFALTSIYFMFLVLRHWLEPKAALAGVALWTTAPLVLHFGQVPMPDILCTTGMLAAFYFALRGNLVSSSGSFLFAALTKPSVVVFGLPILAALLLSRHCRSLSQYVRVSLAWGILPLTGLLAWLALDLFTPETPWTLLRQFRVRGGLSTLLHPYFYIQSAACMLPFGVGGFGLLGLASAALETTPLMNPWLKRSIATALVVYLLIVLCKIAEPQYYLPVLVWLIIAAACGIPRLLTLFTTTQVWRTVLGVVLTAHLLLAGLLTFDLKRSRVSDFPSIQRAARLIPPHARVVVVYRHYGASPAVWLERNVYTVWNEQMLDKELPALRELNFSHLVVLDIESRHSGAWTGQPIPLMTQIAAVLRMKSSAVKLSTPERTYCDQRFHKLFDSQYVALYSLVNQMKLPAPAQGASL